MGNSQSTQRSLLVYIILDIHDCINTFALNVTSVSIVDPVILFNILCTNVSSSCLTMGGGLVHGGVR